MLLVDTTADGAIVLRPTGVYPIEIYHDDRVDEFLEVDSIPASLRERVRARLSEPEDE